MSNSNPDMVPLHSRAWFITEHGEPPVLELRNRLTPTADGDHVLLKVAYAGLNPVTDMLMALPFMPSRIPELDFSGRVVSPGDELEGVRVAGSIPSMEWAKGTGALAQYISVPRACVAPLPEGVSLADGATMIPVLTAQELVRVSGIKTGDHVLINAAAGGVGGLVSQLARKAVGPTGKVVGVCSGSKAELAKSFGVDEVLDYTTGEVAHQAALTPLAPFAACIDALGVAALWNEHKRFLQPGGHFATVGIRSASYGLYDVATAGVRNTLNDIFARGYHSVSLGYRPQELIKEGVEALKTLKIVKDSVWEFEEAPLAFEKLLKGHAGGKILVKVDPSVGDGE